MKNWNTLQPDEYRLLSKHFMKGRAGKKITAIAVHHNAGNLSAKQIYNTWQTRVASAHYQVDQNGWISQHVRDKDTAWAVGGGRNADTISIEHANNKFAPDWTIWDKTLEEGAHLVGALCVYYKLGRPAWKKNVFPHSSFMATACPGAIQTIQNALYMKRAQYWYDQMTGGGVKVGVAKTADKVKTAAQKVADKRTDTVKLAVDGMIGPKSVRRLQQVLGTPVDAVISGQHTANKTHLPAFNAIQYNGGGSLAVKALQRQLGVTADGYLGPITNKAWQKRLGVTTDGYFGPNSAKALQTKLNQGKAL